MSTTESPNDLERDEKHNPTSMTTTASTTTTNATTSVSCTTSTPQDRRRSRSVSKSPLDLSAARSPTQATTASLLTVAATATEATPSVSPAPSSALLPPCKRFKQEEEVEQQEEEDDCQVISAPTPTTTATATTIMSSQEDILVEYSNLINANVHLPHKRVDCGVYPYDPFCNTWIPFCDKCYCVICDGPAKDCQLWSDHSTKQQQQQQQTPSKQQNVVDLAEETPHEDNDEEQHVMAEDQDCWMEENNDEDRLMEDIEQEHRHHYRQDHYGTPQSERKKLRITDVLAKNLRQRSNQTTTLEHKAKEMQGDIPQLQLRSSFFVENVHIGWHFPVILPPQRQMALHIIKALKRKLHVVLESPTGTGKSAAILCAVLAWQRYHANLTLTNTALLLNNNHNDNVDDDDDDNDAHNDIHNSEMEQIPKIIYCSRTHSQIAQMVASLKKTPYRPRMTVLGSRNQLCIHSSVASSKNRSTINDACRTRVANTEYRRKGMQLYDDDNPPEYSPSDGDGKVVENEDNKKNSNMDVEDDSFTHKKSTKVLTCPHYRQLSTQRTAQMLQSRFLLDGPSCSVGGEKTSLGVHDLEDLVTFAKQPYVDSKVAIYKNHKTYGMSLHSSSTTAGHRRRRDPATTTVRIKRIHPGGGAHQSHRLQVGDEILAVNGQDVTSLAAAGGGGLSTVTAAIQATPQDSPLELTVLHSPPPPPQDHHHHLRHHHHHRPHRHNIQEDQSSFDKVSPHSTCPYFLSRAMAPHAEIVFAPYNYILDPNIRKSLGILPLEGNIVILDEAHNVEDTLKESGSGKFGEIELYFLLTWLSRYANPFRPKKASPHVILKSKELGTEESIELREAAHRLLRFVEDLLQHMEKLRETFQISPGNNGAEKAISDWKKFHKPDDNECEVSHAGPSNNSSCKDYLERKLHMHTTRCSMLMQTIQAVETHFGERNKSKEDLREIEEEKEEENRSNDNDLAMLDLVKSLVSKVLLTLKNPEHFYLSIVVQPNGNFSHAAGEEENEQTMYRFRPKPKALPLIFPRNKDNKNRDLPWCSHTDCCHVPNGRRHGEYCNGDKPKWEAHFVVKLLNPALLMKELTNECRTVIFASGSLAPLPSFCAELDLQASMEGSNDPKSPGVSTQSGRLQFFPKPLEANHVIDLPKQLFAVSIGHFPDGSPLTVSYNQYRDLSFFPRLGHAIASVIEAVPRGGVLVFMPSYSFLKKCIQSWQPNRWSQAGNNRANNNNRHHCPEIWERFLGSKTRVIVEPTGSQEDFEKAKQDYTQTIQQQGSCILLAVFRGKMSEGISFNDDYARCVICVGLPYPNAHDRAVKSKIAYNDEQRKRHKRTNLLPGKEWYTQQAYRAIAQALGRCIRHGADYGAIVLMDSRHCDDGAPSDGGLCTAHRNLPKWMRHEIRSLSPGSQPIGDRPIVGGYHGLTREMKEFFEEAPSFCQSILEKWKEDLARARQNNINVPKTFDSKTGPQTPKSTG